MCSTNSVPSTFSASSTNSFPQNPRGSFENIQESSLADLNVITEPAYLQDLLRQRANSEPSRGLIVYVSENSSSPLQISYRELHELAKHNSVLIRRLKKFKENQPILIHLEDQWDAIVWFWSVLLAGGLPVLSSPLSNADEHRHKYLAALSTLLESPICILRQEMLSSFDGFHTFQLKTVESLSCGKTRDCPDVDDVEPKSAVAQTNDNTHRNSKSIAILMLTSGSTGDCKAVCLEHQQVLAAVQGKASFRPPAAGHALLNWIGIDHVASLIEIHLLALWLGLDQVHVAPAAIISSPTLFLDLLSRHRVSRSFAPNFFLAKLISSVPAAPISSKWDLASLTALISGGELNDTKTCVAASAIFESYGAPHNVITTGFGMTETCAGAIYSLDCPAADVESGRSVASLGKCMRGIEMRVTIPTTVNSKSGRTTKNAIPGQAGDLELRGSVVFKEYYRDVDATADAFTADGWFRTGDQATIDSDANLHLIGRVKDVININGVKFPTSDIQMAVERAINTRVARVICFPSRAVHTEQVTVAYTPNTWPIEPREMDEIETLAGQACILLTGSHPLIFSLQERSLSKLPISTLGKISRAKMTSLFQEDVFNEDLLLHRQCMEDFRKQEEVSIALATTAATPAESLLIKDFAEALGVSPEIVGLETRIFDLGCTSMDVMRLKRRMDTRLGFKIPIVLFMKSPTPKALAAALRLDTQIGFLAHDSECKKIRPATVRYAPVVTFGSGGNKTPLWLVHPGVGEVLVFLGLVQRLLNDGRPVYALRARGFEAGQDPFTSIEETVTTYVNAITQQQPNGPYAIAGYSFGAMLAFEVAKRLDAADRGSVQFLGSFNLPPHIKTRMRQMNWNMCLLHLSWFLDLTSEDDMNNINEHNFCAKSRDDALKLVLLAARQSRLNELGLGEAELAQWANVAFSLQSMAIDYEPTGQVDTIDIFHAIPLKAVATSEVEWVREHLSKWSNFSRTEPRYHHVGGAHYTMIGPDHVSYFSQTLMAALRAREL